MTSTATAARNGLRLRWIVPALAVLGIADLALLAQNHSEGEDAVHYIMSVTNGEGLFHPNHLLFNALSWVHYQLWVAVGYTGNATIPMQVASVAASLATVYLVYRLALRTGASSLMAAAAAGMTAFSYGFWVYSLEAETYIVPLPFALASALLLFDTRVADLRGLGRDGIVRLVILGLLTAIATLLHQQYVFLLPIVGLTLLFIWLKTPGRTLAQLITTVGIYGVVAVGLIATTYIAVGAIVYGHQSVFESIAWARGHAKDGMYTAFSPMSFVLAVAGITRALFGINFIFGLPAAADAIAKAAPGKSLVEERYLAEHFIGTTGFWVIVAAMLVAAVAFAWLVFRFVRSIGSGARVEALSPRWIFTRFAAVYLISYAILILIWEPVNPEFWIALIPVSAVLIASRLGGIADAVRPALMLAGAFFVANLIGGIWPYSQANSDYWNNENAGFPAVVGKGDLIITECGFVCVGNLGFTTGADAMSVSDFEAPELEQLLAAPTVRVFISSWAFDPPEGVGIGEGMHNAESLAFIQTIRDRVVEVGRSGSQTIYELKPKA